MTSITISTILRKQNRVHETMHANVFITTGDPLLYMTSGLARVNYLAWHNIDC